VPSPDFKQNRCLIWVSDVGKSGQNVGRYLATNFLDYFGYFIPKSIDLFDGPRLSRPSRRFVREITRKQFRMRGLLSEAQHIFPIILGKKCCHLVTGKIIIPWI